MDRWEIYLKTGDKERLETIYPALVAYDNYYFESRSWKDGSVYSTCWCCVMDNQPHGDDNKVPEIYHGFMSWIDITAKHVLSWRILSKIAKEFKKSEI